MRQGKLTVRVAARKIQAADIASFELTSLDGVDLPPFSAGSHIDVYLAPGLVRQYSLCNSPAERNRYVIGVLHVPQSRGGSEFLHKNVRIGSRLSISAPRNNFPLSSTAKRSLLFAGGIGVTPHLSFAEHLQSEGLPFELHYCARSRERLAFERQIATSPYASRVFYHFDDGPPTQVLDIPRELQRPDAETHIYICGPTGFMDSIVAAALAAGWPQEQVHVERFTAEPNQSESKPFTVVLARSGKTFPVEANETIVQALARNGIEIPVACEQGLCGTCMTRVLAGVPEHRDRLLTPSERASNDRLLPCCSRALTPELTLDL